MLPHLQSDEHNKALPNLLAGAILHLMGIKIDVIFRDLVRKLGHNRVTINKNASEAKGGSVQHHHQGVRLLEIVN